MPQSKWNAMFPLEWNERFDKLTKMFCSMLILITKEWQILHSSDLLWWFLLVVQESDEASEEINPFPGIH